MEIKVNQAVLVCFGELEANESTWKSKPQLKNYLPHISLQAL